MARDRRPANNVLIFFFYGIAVKGPKILHRMIKLTLAVIALVIGIHHIFFYVVIRKQGILI